jgi:hypothetical protein
VKFDGFADEGFRFLVGVADGDDAEKVGNVSAQEVGPFS